MNSDSQETPRKKSGTAKTENVGFRVTEDQLDRIERKALLMGFQSAGKLAEHLVLEFLDGPDENSIPRHLVAIRQSLADARYDLLNVARYIIATTDDGERGEERDAEVERGLKSVMGLPR